MAASQFELNEHHASIANVNNRIHRHGEERQLAADIKFNLSAPNTILDAFDPSLRKDLFRKPNRGEQQDLPHIGGDGLTEVKHTCLEPLRPSRRPTPSETTSAASSSRPRTSTRTKRLPRNSRPDRPRRGMRRLMRAAMSSRCRLGRLATDVTRRLKVEAHAAFDRICKSGSMKRKQAYAWLGKKLGLSERDCHVGWISDEDLRRVVEICEGASA